MKLCFLILLFWAGNAFSQTNIDSLVSLLSQSNNRDRLVILNQIGAEEWGVSVDDRLEYSNEALTIAKEFEDTYQTFLALIHLGIIYLDQIEDHDTAFLYFQDALSYAEQSRISANSTVTNEMLAQTYEMIVQTYIALDDKESAFNTLETLKRVAEASGDDLTMLISLTEFGNYYFYYENIDKAIEFYLEALRIAEYLQNDAKTGLINGHIGDVYAQFGDHDNAIWYYLTAQEYSEKANTLSRTIVLKNSMADLHEDVNNIEQAKALRDEVIEITESVGYEEAYALTLMSNGEMVLEQNEYTDALNYFLRAVEVFERRVMQEEIGNAYSMSGLAYLGLENYDRAIDFLQRAVDVARDNNEFGGLSESLGDIGNVYLNLRQYDRALGYYREALQIAEDLEEKYFEINANTLLSLYYIAMDDLFTATQYVYRALDLALKNDISIDIVAAYESLSFLYAELGDYEKAFEYHELSDAISDSIAKATSGGQIAAMDARHKLEQKDNEIRGLQQENVIHELELGRQTLIRNVSIAGLFLILIFAVGIYNRYRFKTIAHNKLQKAINKIKTLSGLLPICSGCKKIRDDKGYWEQIEVYIQQHSHAEFTHGLCPACLDKYLVEINELKEQKKKDNTSK